MERIKQALEKAQQSPKPEASPAPPAGGMRPAPTLPSDLGAFEYTQSRVVEIDPRHAEQHRIVAFNKFDPMSASFDLLRTQVIRRMDEHGWRTLAITSPSPGAGKTVVAINLAISIAQQTQKTALLVDFDLRRPKVGAYLGLPAERTLNDYLNGDVPLGDTLVNPGMPRLLVLPTARPVPNSSEVLTSKPVRDLMDEMRHRYENRIVIFDLPPMLSTDDALAVLPQIDCALLVVANGADKKSDIEESMALLQRSNFLGSVLNKADVRKKP